MRQYGALQERYWKRKSTVLGETYAAVQIRSLKIPHTEWPGISTGAQPQNERRLTVLSHGSTPGGRKEGNSNKIKANSFIASKYDNSEVICNKIQNTTRFIG
jgi:hypothetical protein